MTKILLINDQNFGKLMAKILAINDQKIGRRNDNSIRQNFGHDDQWPKNWSSERQLNSPKFWSRRSMAKKLVVGTTTQFAKILVTTINGQNFGDQCS